MAESFATLDAWWHAASYLTVGQVSLQSNPLLRDPLRPEHVEPRLLGHWGDHFCREVVRGIGNLGAGGTAPVARCDEALAQHARGVCEHLEDMPEVRDWRWNQSPQDHVLGWENG